MKTKRIFGLLLIGVLTISAADAQQKGAAQLTFGALESLPSQQSGSAATPDAQLQLPADVQSGVQDPQQYPDRMEAVLRSMTAELGEIEQATRDGKISRAQAEYLSLERYYVALTRFQFLRTLYQNPEQNNQGASDSQGRTAPQISVDTVTIPPPTSSPDVSSDIVAYLELNPAQTAAIQAQITDARKQVQPLLERLEKSRRKLISMKLNGISDPDNKVRALAAEQSRIVKQLILANARLEAKIYRMLTTEQQRRVDELRRQGLVSAKVAFPDW